MNSREQNRAIALTAVLEARLTAAEGAELLRISLRHCRRRLAALRRQGPAALAHGNRGRPAPNRLPETLRDRVVSLARSTYAGFNHQHLTEMLVQDDGLIVSLPTVRRWLLAAGIPSPRTRRPRKHRRRRERMPQAGLLVQMDGSHHDWLEGRGPRLVLHGAIDDATNEVPAAIFRLQEDAAGYLWVLRAMARRRGLPVAIYSDRHGIFERTGRPLTLEEQLRGLPRTRTQVRRALDELGITRVPASSPQAKGRVERLWGTFQDRLVSELRRAAITSLEEANRVLAAFLPRYNRRFAVPPAHAEAAYRPSPPGLRSTTSAASRTRAPSPTTTPSASRSTCSNSSPVPADAAMPRPTSRSTSISTAPSASAIRGRSCARGSSPEPPWPNRSGHGITARPQRQG